MFQKTIVEKYLSKLDKNLLSSKYNSYCTIFKNEQKIENIRNSKEEQYQEGFIRDLFVSVLGYTIKPEANYNILTELKNEVANKSNSRKSDAAICEENNENAIRAVIELKGTDTTDLDKVAFQAFSYKNFHNECHYVIVSNFERLRLYVETQSDFEEFNLFTLSFDRFCILYLLLELSQLKADIPLKLKNETVSEEKAITDSFYADYSTFKRLLFEDLVENNPETDKLVLFKKTQKLLDRILFILFCEDRNLLPPNSIAGIISDFQKLKEMGYGQPLYNVFKTFFDRIDKGYKSDVDSTKDIFAYNGGLFKQDELLDALKVGDDVLFIHTKRLSNYDFESQISVDILGRIFENSLTEIEEVQREIEAEKSGEKVENNNIGKRKKDGVFYTPEYITRYIVENTIGKLCKEKRQEYKIDDGCFTSNAKYNKKQLDELDVRLTEYRNWLLQLKILDPACGSGAFLNAALTQLKNEHTLIDQYYANIHHNALNFDSVDNDSSILENNLYGVDINEDSVEITKLSLWLHTAKKNRKLTTLNGKIKCGNSLIDDPSVAGDKAFDWQKEFPEVFEKGGFDVVIGNPPYVRAELLSEKDIAFYNIRYKVFTPDGDLFSYFYEKGMDLVKTDGLFGFISNTFDKTTAGKILREYISTNTKIEDYVDFTDVQIFQGATTYPIILILKNNVCSDNYFPYRKIPKEMNGKVNINIVNEIIIQQSSLKKSESWSFKSEEQKNVIKKITAFPTVLDKFGKCYYGVKTALNEAFFVNDEVKKRLILEDEKSKELIKPVFEGKDLSKWINLSIEKYVLLIHNGYEDKEPIKIEEYPALKQHLDYFYDKLEKRYDKGVTPYNLRNCAYQGLFERNKIIWGNLQNSNKFSYDCNGTIVSAPCCMLPTDCKSLVSILNSKIVWTFLTSVCVVRSGGYIEVKPQYFEKIPIPEFEADNNLDVITDKMLALNETLQKKSNNFLKVVQQTFALDKVSTKLENFYELDFDGFIKELKQKVTPKIKLEWLEVFEETKKELLDLKQQIDETDKEINQMVYKLYNLTDDEIAIIENGI